MLHNKDKNATKKKGEAAKYITRNQAIKLCQISLKTFRRLCVLKGIYPRQPNSYRKAQKGDPTERILYLKSDIRSLIYDPAVMTVRRHKQYLRNFNKYIRKGEHKKARALKRKKPIVNVDHMILERYPTFEHALQDLDDPLTTLFLTYHLQSSKIHPSVVVNRAKRLAVEFIHYVIETKALRKVFITVKGYYYRAQIKGIDVTWVVPHPFPIKDDSSLDQTILQHVNEFYIRFMSFINYKLYINDNLVYPPRIESYMDRIKSLNAAGAKTNLKLKKKCIKAKSDMKNTIASLSVPIMTNKDGEDENEENDKHDKDLLKGVFGKKTEGVMDNLKWVQKQKTIFKGLKFFLNRETNRESLTFVIRSGGGEVSWDYSLGHGHRYPEEDKTITHQIVDRPEFEVKHLTRYYVQPQWVYDSFNFSHLMPVQDYVVGATLPPHLSPFEETYDNYVPPALKKVYVMREEAEKTDLDAKSTFEPCPELPKLETIEEMKPKNIKTAKVPRAGPLAKMDVKECAPIVRNLKNEMKKSDEMTKKFAEKMVHKRQKKLFNRIVEVEESKKQKANRLAQSRALIEGYKKGKLTAIIEKAKTQKSARKIPKNKQPKTQEDGVRLLAKKKQQKKTFHPQNPVWNR